MQDTGIYMLLIYVYVLSTQSLGLNICSSSIARSEGIPRADRVPKNREHIPPPPPPKKKKEALAYITAQENSVKY